MRQRRMTSKTRATLRLLEQLAPPPDPDADILASMRYGLVRVAPCHEGPAPAPHLRPPNPYEGNFTP